MTDAEELHVNGRHMVRANRISVKSLKCLISCTVSADFHLQSVIVTVLLTMASAHCLSSAYLALCVPTKAVKPLR